jgi:hypothetical protein
MMLRNIAIYQLFEPRPRQIFHTTSSAIRVRFKLVWKREAVTIERIGPPLQEEGWVVMVFAGNPLDPPPSSTDGPGAVGEHCLSA